MRGDDLYKLRKNIPIPVDGGACDHLPGIQVPSIQPGPTAGRYLNLAEVFKRTTIVYCYPRTGVPNADPEGGLANWNTIPGAHGCTPQACVFRDHFNQLHALNVSLFGLSSQSTKCQLGMERRLHLPFEVLSDSQLEFTRALRLPTFEAQSARLIKRLTFVAEKGRIVKVFYPVFRPDKNAEGVIAWLSLRLV